MRADDTAFIQVSLSWFMFLRGVRPLVSKNRLCHPTGFVGCSAVVGSAKSSSDGQLKQLSVDNASMRKSFEVQYSRVRALTFLLTTFARLAKERNLKT